MDSVIIQVLRTHGIAIGSNENNFMKLLVTEMWVELWKPPKDGEHPSLLTARHHQELHLAGRGRVGVAG